MPALVRRIASGRLWTACDIVRQMAPLSFFTLCGLIG